MNSRYATIEEIVLDALVDEGEVNATHKFQRYLRWAIRGAEDLVFDGIIRTTKTVELIPNGYRAADLPKDFLDWLAIGLKPTSSSEHVVMFVNDPTLSLFLQRNDCGDLLPNQDCLDDSSQSNLFSLGPFLSNYGSGRDKFRNGSYVGAEYGAGGGNPGPGFTIDNNRNQILFGSMIDGLDSNGPIIMEYQPTFYKADGKTEVHVYTREAIVAYIHWKRAEAKEYIPANAKERSRREYFNERRRATNRIKAIPISDLLNAVRKNNMQAPKT